MTKHINQVYFPEELIELSRETAYHPELLEKLEKIHPHEWELRFGTIAAYCEVMLDGVYVQSDIERLSKILKDRLEAKRVAPSILIN